MPTGRRWTSWLCTSIAEELKHRLPGIMPVGMVVYRAGLYIWIIKWCPNLLVRLPAHYFFQKSHPFYFWFVLYNIVMKCVFIDLNAGHSCSANYKEEDEEEEEEESHAQQTRRTSTERPREDSYSEDVTTKNTKAMPRPSKDQLSPSKSARITSCGRFDPQKLLVM